MNIIQHLIKKHNLSPSTYYTTSPYVSNDMVEREAHQRDFYTPFHNKWMPYTEDGWYGPAGLGFPMPVSWYAVLDEFLEYCKATCPDFKIHQLKVKFGGIRIYLANISPEVAREVSMLETLLYDDFLVY